MAVGAVGIDQLDHPGALVDLALVGELPVDQPPHRLVGNAQRREDLVVELVGGSDSWTRRRNSPD